MKNFSGLLILIICFIFTKNVSAQTFSIRAGLITSGSASFDYKYTMYDYDFNTNPGIHFGLIMEIPLSEIMALETGILVNSQSRELMVIDPYNVLINSSRNRTTSLMMPLAAKIFFNIGKTRIYGSTGPYLGNYIRTGLIFFITEIDYGLFFGSGIEVGKFQFGINYAHGIPKVPLTDNNEQTIKSRTFTLFAAYKLRRKNK